MWLRSVISLSIGLFCVSVSMQVVADYRIEIIELKARPLDEILPVIQPFAGADGTVTGMGNTLVIKASPVRVAEIRQLLLSLDRPPRRLLITVGNQGDVTGSSSGYRASADVKTGDSHVSVNSPGHPVDSSRAHIRLHDSNMQRAQTSRYQLQALEGRPAYINSGTRIPLQTTQHYYGPGVPHARKSTQLQDVTSGFYVVPRLQGDEVTLEIVQHDDKPGQRRGVINTQSAGTVVRGRLGEWVALGAVNTSGSNRADGLGQSVNSRQSYIRDIQVRVECLDCGGQAQPLDEFEWSR